MDPQQRREILLRLLCRRDESEPAQRLRQMEPEDWAAIIEEGFEQQVAPLLYRRLKPAFPELKLPAGAEERLKGAYLLNYARNVRLFYRLGRLLVALNGRQLPAIPLKGTHLAALVYGDIGVRKMIDVDLLVHEADLFRVNRMLKELEDLFGAGWLRVDLHLNIESASSPFRIDAGGLWERAVEAEMGGVPARVLCAEDLFLHQCLHSFYRHQFCPVGIRAFCDMQAILDRFRGEMDWGGLERRARRWGAGNCLNLALELLECLIGEAPPIRQQASPGPDKIDPRLLSFAREQFLKHVPGERISSPYFLHFLQPGRPVEKVGLLLRSLFPPREVMSGRYLARQGTPKLYYYYLYRLFRILQVSLRTLARKIRREKTTVQLTRLNRWLSAG